MSEYSYEIDKYIVGVDNNGEDGIGLTIATMKDNELHILGSCYGNNARFIDLLIKENQKYKEVIDKAIEWVKDWTNGANDWFEEDSKPSELLDILKEV